MPVFMRSVLETMSIPSDRQGKMTTCRGLWQQGEAVWDKLTQGITAFISGSDGSGGYGRMPTEKAYESMEYNPPNSALYRSWLARQPHGRTWDKWLLMALIGSCVGTVSFLLQQAIKVLFAAREKVGRYFLDWDMVGGYMLAWFFYVAVSAAFATGASFLVVKVAPAASASGVPGIMAFLNGVRVPKVCDSIVRSVCSCFTYCSALRRSTCDCCRPAAHTCGFDHVRAYFL